MPKHLQGAAETDFAIEASTAMETVTFRIGDRSMDILMGYRCTEAIAAHIGSMTDHIVLVADQRVFHLWGAQLASCLAAHVRMTVIPVDAVESHKSMNTVQSILDRAVSDGVTRRSIVLSFGGGLTGNLAGLAAGLLFRGIRLIHIPTTLLAMSDSILSQKQAVNGAATKNLYGLFHLADLAFVDVQYLHTLPDTEYSAGLIELCKNGLAFDLAALPQLKRLVGAGAGTPTDWFDLVRLGIRSKQQLLLDDPLESGSGIVLEYGHTLGHALELEMGDITHGHAVGLGMLAAAAISRGRGWLSEADEWLHAELLVQAGAPVALPRSVGLGALVARIRQDNKRGKIALQESMHAFVILKKLGCTASTDGIPLVAVEESEIERAFENLATGYYSRAEATQ